MEVQPIHRANGGIFECSYCRQELGLKRSVLSTADGPKFFCPKEDPQTEACVVLWLRRFS